MSQKTLKTIVLILFAFFIGVVVVYLANQFAHSYNAFKTVPSEKYSVIHKETLKRGGDTKTTTITPTASPQTQVSKGTTPITYYPVVRVVDGDTLKVKKDGRMITVRLIGIDTPETVDSRTPVQCFGKEASNEAKALLNNTSVHLESDASQQTYDIYGRLLAYVYTQKGLFFNRYMISQGYAHEYTYKGVAYQYQAQFKQAQREAQLAHRGLWQQGICDTWNTTHSLSL